MKTDIESMIAHFDTATKNQRWGLVIGLLSNSMRKIVLDTMEGAPQAIESHNKAKLLDIVTRMSDDLDGIDLSSEEMTENVKFFNIITQASHELHGIDFPSKDTVKNDLRAAMRLVNYDAAEKKALGTITSKEQTQALENYLRFLIYQQQDLLLIRNLMIADMMREQRRIWKPLRAYDKLPKWLKDIGMTQRTFAKYKARAELPDNKFEDWVAPWLTRENNLKPDREELQFCYLDTYIRNLRKKGELWED
jgi:hypothetical protein